jgi:hypothetical protein
MTRFGREPAAFRLLRWLCIAAFVLYAVPGVFAGYRAWVQVRSLELMVPSAALRAGDVVRVRTVSWARTYVTVRLLLIQGVHAETLAVHEISKNVNASLDPRWRRDSIIVRLTAPLLARYVPGAAVLRASGVGRPQWMRLPPPLVREAAVQIVPAP